MTVMRLLTVIAVIWFSLLGCSAAAAAPLDEQEADSGGAEPPSSISSSPDDPQNNLNIIQERRTQRESLIRIAPLQSLRDAANRGEDALYQSIHLKLGLAFQAVDDILDMRGTDLELGKHSGRDIELRKATYPAILGIEESDRVSRTLVDAALADIAFLPNGSELREIAQYVVRRRH